MTDFFIYNFRQAEFFIAAGVQLLEIGVGKKGDTYLRFVRDAYCEKVFDEWNATNPNRCKGDVKDDGCNNSSL